MDDIKFCRSGTRLAACGAGYQLIGESGLSLKKEKRLGAFLTQVYDSGKTDMAWNRLCLDVEHRGRMRVYVLASNRAEDWSLLDGPSPWKEKLAFCRQNACISSHSSDILLFEARGRFLRICIEIFDPSGSFLLRGYACSFPKQTFAGYLPQIYRGNAALEKYIGILQAVYMDTERRIDAFPALLDPRAADCTTLRSLLRWTGIEAVSPALPDNPDTWELETARRLLQNAVWLNRRKGTRPALERLLLLLAEEAPVVVEAYQWLPLAGNLEKRGLYRSLYGDGPSFTVLFRREPRVGRDTLERAVREFSPLGTQGRVVILRDTAPLNGHCYLGLNSRLHDSERAVLREENPVSVSMRLR